MPAHTPESGGGRATVCLETATVIHQFSYEGAQHLLRVHAPKIAAAAVPGHFVHIRCDQSLPMRRPMSIMRAHTDEGWVEFLYKVVGHGTKLLSRHQAGTELSILGPIGKPFTPARDRTLALLLGGGVGIPPMIFLAERLRASRENHEPFVIMGSEVPFPFTPQPSRLVIPGMPEGTIACMPLMEDWGIASRLASLQGYPGCFQGFVTELARSWLAVQDGKRRKRIQIFACGPVPMLKACAELAREFDVPCEISLEEFMACGVGGCAGCIVPVATQAGRAMQRVCVDGPVFDAQAIVWP